MRQAITDDALRESYVRWLRNNPHRFACLLTKWSHGTDILHDFLIAALAHKDLWLAKDEALEQLAELAIEQGTPPWDEA